MSKPFAKTESVCPVCLKKIEAQRTLGDDGFIHLEKSCPEHGCFDTLIWEGGIASYLNWDRGSAGREFPEGAREIEKGCPYDCGLCAAHEREGCCVLLELTSRCNLRCPVCFASAGEGEGKDLSLSEIASLYDMLMERGGPYNIQLSGGEPTVRDDLPEIIDMGRSKGFSFFQMNSNGLRIAGQEGYALELAQAGASCVFLQFDSLDDEAYRMLRGRPLAELKLRAIENCGKSGLPVVLTPTVAPGVNEGELGEILSFALSKAPAVRGVHFQPISYFGRCSLEPPKIRLTLPKMLRLIEEQTGGLMKAADFSGGGAESPYCSFHASYRRLDEGFLKALPRRENACCCQTSFEARDFVSRQWGLKPPENPEAELSETASLDEFLKDAVENTFTVSGMLFQDAWNLDLERLRRCYICEADLERGMVPFCAYNLTDIDGRALYRP
ncbi:MAG: radical SAM protein [Oscillospiraceae bacterium]|nr:radical SAM protein [Oscillospiraceae bacterium]